MFVFSVQQLGLCCVHIAKSRMILLIVVILRFLLCLFILVEYLVLPFFDCLHAPWLLHFLIFKYISSGCTELQKQMNQKLLPIGTTYIVVTRMPSLKDWFDIGVGNFNTLQAGRETHQLPRLKKKRFVGLRCYRISRTCVSVEILPRKTNNW